jgi:hypothetical protein
MPSKCSPKRAKMPAIPLYRQFQSVKFTAPFVHLDRPNVNPQVHECLRDHLPDFVFQFTREKTLLEQTAIVEKATNSLLWAFDFNWDRGYEAEIYLRQLRVRTCVLPQSRS